MTIHRKTQKGRDEIETRRHGLSAQQRRLLILIDDRRSVDELRSMLLLSEFDSALQALFDAGYIEDTADGRPAAKRSAVAPAVQPFSPEEEGIVAFAREVIIETSQRHAGIYGAEVIGLAKAAASREAMQRCIARWKLVLQESRSGPEVAQQHFEEVRLLLRNIVFS